MKITKAMVDAAMGVHTLHGLVAATGMSTEQYREVLEKSLQAALDAHPILAGCEIIFAQSDISQLRAVAGEDAESIVANCRIKLAPPPHAAEVTG